MHFTYKEAYIPNNSCSFLVSHQKEALLMYVKKKIHISSWLKEIVFENMQLWDTTVT